MHPKGPQLSYRVGRGRAEGPEGRQQPPGESPDVFGHRIVWNAVPVAPTEQQRDVIGRRGASRGGIRRPGR
jgi:hypothetical protein